MPEHRPHFVEFTRSFKAPPGEVFEAFVDPEAILDWWAPRGWHTPIAEMDVRVGGRYRFGMRGDDDPALMYVQGEYLEIEPPRLLKFTYIWEPGGAGERWRPVRLIGVRTIVTLTFEASAGGTEVRLRHEGFPTAEGAAQHHGGWCSNWDCLDEYLATHLPKPHRHQ
jgi:uncharacterized protein YndB with AHSA1/START domain